MKLGEGVEQSIHIVTMLSGLANTAVLPAKALAEFHGTSVSYLLKHLQAMSAAGILTSVPGPKGGYRLARPAAQISLLDVLIAVEGPAPAFRCCEIRRRGPQPLPSEFFTFPCGINTAMLRAERAYRNELSQISIAEIVEKQSVEENHAVQSRISSFLIANQRGPS